MALDPVDVSTPRDDTARPMGDGSSARIEGQRELRITIGDEFGAMAAEEYQEGHVDPALWARASAQFGVDDESLVIAAYLRARATALKIRKRNKRLERRARGADSMHATGNRNGKSEPYPELLSANTVGVRLGGVQPSLKYVAVAAVVFAFVAAVVAWIAPPQESEVVGQPSVSAAAPSAQKAARARPVVANASGATNQNDLVPALEVTVQKLKDAGNWNVLVLHASKWTRVEPKNAAAWNELSIGYANLRQFDDALAAATKAVELSAADSLLWRNLGHLNLTVERLPEAGSAFDRALAVRPDDVDALCGAALVARRLGRTKDADAIARRVKSVDGSCPGANDAESVAVVAGGFTARKPVPSVGR